MGQTLAREDPYTEVGRDDKNPAEAYFKVSDLRLWAERTERRAIMPVLFPEDRKAAETDNRPDPSEWAALSHDTKLLKAVRWAIATWWEGKDPLQGPTKELVVEKLQALHRLTKNEAEAVDLVTRPDSRRRSAPEVPTKERSNRKA
jgi:hypothetical protein